MLYCVNLSVGPEYSIKVVLMAKVKEISQSTFSFRHLLGDPRVIPALANHGERVNIIVPDPNKGAVEPYLPYPIVGHDAINEVDITSVYNFISGNVEQFTPELLKALAGKLKDTPVGPYVGEEELAEIKQNIVLMERYRKGEDLIKVDVPELFYHDVQVTMKLLKEHNGRLGHQFKYITSDINRTNFMESPSDEFFIEIPKYEKLRSDDFSIESLLPRMGDIAKPYPHPIYHTPYASRVFSISHSQLGRTLVEVDSLIPLTDEQKQAVPKIEVQELIGSSENNDKGIMPNEEDYYNALTEYIKYDIAQTHPGQDVEELYKTLKGSDRMLAYLQQLVKRLASMNWTHTGKYPVSEDVKSLSDEDDYSYTSDDEGTEAVLDDPNLFLDLEGSGHVENGHDILQYYIDAAATVGGEGFNAYVEAIIKLARWGSMKPTVLKLGDYDLYMDLNNLTIRHTTGNLSSMTPLTVNGSELSFEGLIMFQERFRDPQYREKVGLDTQKISIPVGFVCRKHFKAGATQDVYVSFFDLYSEYKNNPNAKLIDGISFEGGRFVANIPSEKMSNMTTLTITHNTVAQSADKLHVNRVSQGIRELVLEFGAKELSNLNVLHTFLYSQDAMSKGEETYKFSSKEELASKIAANPLPIEQFIKYNIARVTLPVLFKATQEFDQNGQYEMQQILDCYMKAVSQTGYTSETQFLSTNESQVEPEKVPSAMDSTAQRLAQMTSFGGTPTETSAPAQQVPQVSTPVATATKSETETAAATVNVASHIIEPYSSQDTVYAIQDNGKTIGGFAVKKNERGRTYYLLCGASRVPEGAPVSPNPFKTLEVLVFDALWKLSTGDISKLNAKFDHTDSIKEIRDLLKG